METLSSKSLRPSTEYALAHGSRIDVIKKDKTNRKKKAKQRKQNIVVSDIMYCTYQNTTLA